MNNPEIDIKDIKDKIMANLRRTKLRLKNNLNDKIQHLEETIVILEDKLQKLDWANEWANIEK